MASDSEFTREEYETFLTFASASVCVIVEPSTITSERTNFPRVALQDFAKKHEGWRYTARPASGLLYIAYDPKKFETFNDAVNTWHAWQRTQKKT